MNQITTVIGLQDRLVWKLDNSHYPFSTSRVWHSIRDVEQKVEWCMVYPVYSKACFYSLANYAREACDSGYDEGVEQQAEYDVLAIVLFNI